MRLHQNKLKSLKVAQSKDDDGGWCDVGVGGSVMNAFMNCCVNDGVCGGVGEGVCGGVSDDVYMV